MRALVISLLLFGLISAIHVLEPVDEEVDEADSIYIGKIGPGQTISVLIEEEVETGGKFGIGGIYDSAYFDKVPDGWHGKKSDLHAHPLHVALTADSEAEEGSYLARITVEDEENRDGLGTVSFWVKVDITHDVMDANVEPTMIRAGPGQPARFELTITNKGSTGDAFDISSIGAKRWEFQRSVFVPAKSSKKIYYEIVADEEEVYRAQISIKSKASPTIIHEEKNITVDIRSDIFGDMKATNNGVILFPIFESLIYSFFGLISNIF